MRARLRRADRRRGLLTGTALALASLLTGCTGASAESTAANSTAAVSFPEKLTSAAERAAARAAHGKKPGGSIEIIGVNGGTEGAIIDAAIRPFEKATGITVRYQGSADSQALIQSRVQAGNPPDLIDAANAGQMRRYQAEGELKDVGSWIGEDTLRRDFNSSLLDSSRLDGKVYGIWSEVDNFMVWYNTHRYTGSKRPASQASWLRWAKQRAAAGHTPFCMGLESGSGTGWPAGNVIEALFAKKYGAAKLRAWSEDRLSWSSPEVRDAWETFGKISGSPDMVAGGPVNTLVTNLVNYSDGLFDRPARCDMSVFGTYAAGLARVAHPEVKSLTDMDFYPVPAASARAARAENVGGHLLSAFTDSPQTRAFARYWASAEAQSLLASSGQWTVGNQRVPASVYTDPALAKAARTLLAPSKQLVAGPSFTALPGVMDAYDKGIVSYLQDPTPATLTTVLAGLDATTRDAR
ncbi:ABC transporter substrate-binding protein [Streptomyces fractus]|uniref:ABC transporter substrate-binding protein n=1 Tax=Streptomyces fractus TaxID=641806 RepID=UPI003CEB733F